MQLMVLIYIFVRLLAQLTMNGSQYEGRVAQVLVVLACMAAMVMDGWAILMTLGGVKP